MERYPAAGSSSPTLVLAHGAGAGEHHPWMRRVAAGLAAHGVSVVTFEFPYMRDQRGRPDPPPVLEAAFTTVWREVADGRECDAPLFAGGKSMGGRIASQVAAAGGFSPPAAGLVFFGYPLHPRVAPSRRRDRHLPNVAAPMLFVHGTRDPFGDAGEMRDLATGLPGAQLHLIPGGDHSLAAPKRDDPTGRSLDDAVEIAARWILAMRAGHRPTEVPL